MHIAYYACVIIPHLIPSLPFVDFASKELRREFARGINDGFERRDGFGRRYYCWIVCMCAGLEGRGLRCRQLETRRACALGRILADAIRGLHALPAACFAATCAQRL